MLRKRSDILTMPLIFLLSTVSADVMAQARYDDHDIDDRWSLNLGGYDELNHKTIVRLDSKTRVLGTVLDMEDRLNLEEDTGTVSRLDGYYRISRAHRIAWSWYRVDRLGVSPLIDSQIQVGDRIFQVGSIVSSESESEVFKLGYAWSFINVEPYEFYLGVGLNVHKSRLHFTNRLSAGQGAQLVEYEAEGTAPLPTLSFGMRYNLTDKWIANWKYEVFAINTGNYGGRFQESTLGIEHNTWNNVGLGFSVTNFSKSIDAEDGRYRGEFDSSYLGLQLYLKTYF